MMNLYDTVKQIVNDAWQNVYTGLGTALDRTTGHVPVQAAWCTAKDLEALYEADPRAQRIICELVDTAFRSGWTPVLADNEEDSADVSEEQSAIVELLDGDEEGSGIGATQAIMEAIYWGRLYGRGGLLLGADDGRQLAEPLDDDRVRQLLYVEPLTSEEFFPSTYYDDPVSPGYGTPETWMVQRVGDISSNTVQVHASRILVTSSGVPTSRRRLFEEAWRWQPLLQSIYDDLRAYSSAQMSVSHMLTDASTAVLRITGLAQLLATEDSDVLARRLRILDQGRAIRVLPIDTDEQFSYSERTFTGIADATGQVQASLAGAAGYPQTLLFGKGTPGLANEEVTSDRYWTGKVRAAQREYTRLVLRLVRLAARAAGVANPERWTIEWGDVWSRTPAEEAEHRKAVAEADKTYIAEGVLLPEEVAIKRFGGASFDDGAPQIDTESRQALIEQDRSRAAEPPPRQAPGPGGEPEAVADAWRNDPDVEARPPEEKKGKLVVQSVRLPDTWSKEQAQKWLREHGYRSTVERPYDDDEWWARQYNPEHFKNSSYRRKEIGEGVALILARVG